MPRPARPAAVIALLALLAGCGGVATDAPSLLSPDEIASRASPTTVSGEAMTQQLLARAARLDARANRLRRAGIDRGERTDLLRRAEGLATQGH